MLRNELALVLLLPIACLDASNYDHCVEQSTNRRHVYEHCQPGFTDECPEAGSSEARNKLDVECADLDKVLCGPAEPTPSEDTGECCYVVRVTNEADNCR